MTPNDLKSMIEQQQLEVSFVGVVTDIDRNRLADYLNGNIGALSSAEVARLTKRLVISDELKNLSESVKQNTKSLRVE